MKRSSKETCEEKNKVLDKQGNQQLENQRIEVVDQRRQEAKKNAKLKATNQ